MKGSSRMAKTTKKASKKTSKKKATRKVTETATSPVPEVKAKPVAKVAKKVAKKSTAKKKVATKKVAKKSPPVAVTPAPQVAPTFDEIAARAYDIWVRKGRPYGQDHANWKEAEAELWAQRS